MHPIAPRYFVPLGGLCRFNAAGDHQRGTAFDASGNFQRRRHFGRRQRNHRQIGLRVGQLGQRAAGVYIQKRQRAGKALCPQCLVQSARLERLGVRIVGLARKNNDRVWGKKWCKKVFVHTDFN